MSELKLDAVVTLDPANLRWMSAWQDVFDDESAHVALITATRAYIHTDSRYSEAMESENNSGIWKVSAQQQGHFTFVKKALARTRKESLRLGFESDIRHDLYKALRKAVSSTPVRLKETTDLFGGLRAVKDEEEIRLLRKAQTITDEAFAELLDWIRPGMTELEAANRLDYSLREKGAEGIAFQTIAASGPRSALPHARPTGRVLSVGDFLVLDFGARYRDYCADMTRTLVIGEATEEQRRVYSAVLDAQAKARTGIRAGITGKQADAIAREAFKAAGLAKAFTHSLGHGVGINVHEKPTLSPHNDRPLLAGNVVTVEPGVYLPGFGGVRIEDFGVVGEAAFIPFTLSPHDLIEIRP